MARTVVIDELHLTIRIPKNLPDDQAGAIRRTLDGADFTNRLRRAVQGVVRAFWELSAVSITLSR